jgi:hypothetical protein
MTNFISNLVITKFINSWDQMRVLPVNQISYLIDNLILIMYGLTLAMAYHYNILKNGPFRFGYLIQKRRFQYMIYSIVTLFLARWLVLVFGTLIT